MKLCTHVNVSMGTCDEPNTSLSLTLYCMCMQCLKTRTLHIIALRDLIPNVASDYSGKIRPKCL